MVIYNDKTAKSMLAESQHLQDHVKGLAKDEERMHDRNPEDCRAVRVEVSDLSLLTGLCVLALGVSLMIANLKVVIMRSEIHEIKEYIRQNDWSSCINC